MRRILLRFVSIGLASILFSALAFAQEGNRRLISEASNLYVVSAEAGGINYVEGKVLVERKNAKSNILRKGDTLEIGDRVLTGTNGKVEILLNPGSFVRLAENSTFEFTTTSLEDLQLNLIGGSAMFEVITTSDFNFAVKTPKSEFYIIKTGVYRIDVLSDGASKIEVWKGKAQIGANATEVKGGKQANVNGSQATITKFDRDDKDSLELFSKTRAKELSKINALLQKSAMRTSLLSSFQRGRWNMYGSYGLWIFDAAYGSFCFLPFGEGWNSPYGYYYRRNIWQYNLPPVIYNQPPPITTTNPNPRITSAETNANNPKIRRSRQEADSPQFTPPFEKVQRDLGQSPIDRQGDMFPLPMPSVQPSSPLPPPSAPTVINSAETSIPTKKGDN